MSKINGLKSIYFARRNSAKSLAEKHGVSARKIKNDGEFVNAIKKVQSLDPELEKGRGKKIPLLRDVIKVWSQ